jgi:peptidoglycan/LPS O-acetylase OafA/YrhL
MRALRRLRGSHAALKCAWGQPRCARAPIDDRAAASSNRIVQLDGLRGLSILFVVIGHVIGHLSRTMDFGVTLPSMGSVLAGLGVDIFFVISGFIITKLALRELNQTGHFSVGSFYARRFFRIGPPLFSHLGAVFFTSSYSLITERPSEILPAVFFSLQFSCSDVRAICWTYVDPRL